MVFLWDTQQQQTETNQYTWQHINIYNYMI